MEIVTNKICQKHNLQANRMCTRPQCFQQANILICRQCINQHSLHTSDVIEISLLNEKVHELMQKRMQFEKIYQKSCDDMINELKKFKMFKEDIINCLNYRERYLNQLCKKIRKNIPYQKDKNLFKNHLGYIYLSMKGLNPNIDLYRNFRQNLYDTINQCRKSLHRLQLNINQVPMLLTKDHQICSILKKVRQQSILPIQCQQPNFKLFKKQTVRLKQDCSKIYRLSGQQFITLSKQTKTARWYTSQNFLFPRILSIGVEVQNIAIFDKTAYLVTELGGILLYDILNEKIIKQYASTKHKNAAITNLLPISNSNILNFVTCPNQIVSIQLDQQYQTLKMIKGIQTKSKCLASQLFYDKFVSCFDDKTVKIYNNQYLEKQMEIDYQNLMKSIAKINQNCYILGGQCNYILMMDSRINGIVSKIPINSYSQQIKNIYPMCVMKANNNTIQIIDLRKQQEIFHSKSDQPIKHLQVLSSNRFVTSGKNLQLWESI